MFQIFNLNGFLLYVLIFQVCHIIWLIVYINQKIFICLIAYKNYKILIYVTCKQYLNYLKNCLGSNILTLNYSISVCSLSYSFNKWFKCYISIYYEKLVKKTVLKNSYNSLKKAHKSISSVLVHIKKLLKGI